MILRNSEASYTAKFENAVASPIYNANRTITIGGLVKSQTDSRRLKIISTILIPQDEIASLNVILEDYTRQIYYTPNCTLYDRTTIEEIPVIMSEDPRIEQKIFYDIPVFYITIVFEEVLTL